jgi:hypothetical protein
MRHGGDHRGSAESRRLRKLWLLRTYGDGFNVVCVHCSTLLNFATVEADRIVPDGPYARHNVLPSCGCCNKRLGNLHKKARAFRKRRAS